MSDKFTLKRETHQQTGEEIKTTVINLTPRENEVIRTLASDFPDKQIADYLGITISTLNTHKTHLFEKFAVHSKTGLIMKAFELNIIP